MKMNEISARGCISKPLQETEIGLLPHDWEVIRLSTRAKIQSGIAKNANAKLREPTTVPYLRVANVQDGFLDLTEVSTIEIERGDLSRYAVLLGDVLMNEGGDLDKLGRGAIWQGEVNPCVHQNHVFVVRCKGGLVPEYLNAWTSSAQARRYFMLAGKQTTNLASINKTSLGDLTVAVPPTEDEQKEIATALTDAVALVDSLEQLLTKKRQIRQGAMQELLTGKRRTRQKEEWHRLRLGDVATLKARIGWQGLTTAEYRERGEHLLVTGTEFAAGRIQWDACHYVDRDRYDQDKHIQLGVGDVLVTKDGTIGKVALVDALPTPATLNSGIFVVRPRNDSFHPGFFYYLLSSTAFSSFLGQLSAGSTINHLYQKDFVHFMFEAPKDLDEQREIFDLLAEIDTDITTIEARLTKARALKQAMAQALLTGRIRLVGPQA